MKILIIGFPRSGTSLMKRIIMRHPDVEKIFFEANLMKRIGTNRENTLNILLPPKKNVGEKVIYEKGIMGTKRSGSPTPVEYCQRWNNRFKKEARIIQIIRHPYDVWNSILIKKYIARNKKHAIIKMFKNYFKYIPKCFDRISKFENCLTVKYEDVIMNPNILNLKIYRHCNLSLDFKMAEHMKRSKVFAYKRIGFKIHDSRLVEIKENFMEIMNKNIDDCLIVLNKFPGVIYER